MIRQSSLRGFIVIRPIAYAYYDDEDCEVKFYHPNDQRPSQAIGLYSHDVVVSLMEEVAKLKRELVSHEI